MDELRHLAIRYVAAEAAWARRYPDGSASAEDLDLFDEHQADHIDELHGIADQLITAILGRQTDDPWPQPQTCQACGTVFLIAHKRKFCADPVCQRARAYQAYRKDHPPVAYSKVCARCGAGFVTNRVEARFCSTGCRNAHHRAKLMYRRSAADEAERSASEAIE